MNLAILISLTALLFASILEATKRKSGAFSIYSAPKKTKALNLLGVLEKLHSDDEFKALVNGYEIPEIYELLICEEIIIHDLTDRFRSRMVKGMCKKNVITLVKRFYYEQKWTSRLLDLIKSDYEAKLQFLIDISEYITEPLYLRKILIYLLQYTKEAQQFLNRLLILAYKNECTILFNVVLDESAFFIHDGLIQSLIQKCHYNTQIEMLMKLFDTYPAFVCSFRSQVLYFLYLFDNNDAVKLIRYSICSKFDLEELYNHLTIDPGQGYLATAIFKYFFDYLDSNSFDPNNLPEIISRYYLYILINLKVLGMNYYRQLKMKYLIPVLNENKGIIRNLLTFLFLRDNNEEKLDKFLNEAKKQNLEIPDPAVDWLIISSKRNLASFMDVYTSYFPDSIYTLEIKLLQIWKQGFPLDHIKEHFGNNNIELLRIGFEINPNLFYGYLEIVNEFSDAFVMMINFLKEEHVTFIKLVYERISRDGFLFNITKIDAAYLCKTLSKISSCCWEFYVEFTKAILTRFPKHEIQAHHSMPLNYLEQILDFVSPEKAITFLVDFKHADKLLVKYLTKTSEHEILVIGTLGLDSQDNIGSILYSVYSQRPPNVMILLPVLIKFAAYGDKQNLLKSLIRYLERTISLDDLIELFEPENVPDFEFFARDFEIYDLQLLRNYLNYFVAETFVQREPKFVHFLFGLCHSNYDRLKFRNPEIYRMAFIKWDFHIQIYDRKYILDEYSFFASFMKFIKYQIDDGSFHGDIIQEKLGQVDHIIEPERNFLIFCLQNDIFVFSAVQKVLNVELDSTEMLSILLTAPATWNEQWFLEITKLKILDMKVLWPWVIRVIPSAKKEFLQETFSIMSITKQVVPKCFYPLVIESNIIEAVDTKILSKDECAFLVILSRSLNRPKSTLFLVENCGLSFSNILEKYDFDYLFYNNPQFLYTELNALKTLNFKRIWNLVSLPNYLNSYFFDDVKLLLAKASQDGMKQVPLYELENVYLKFVYKGLSNITELLFEGSTVSSSTIRRKLKSSILNLLLQKSTNYQDPQRTKLISSPLIEVLVNNNNKGEWKDFVNVVKDQPVVIARYFYRRNESSLNGEGFIRLTERIELLRPPPVRTEEELRIGIKVKDVLVSSENQLTLISLVEFKYGILDIEFLSMGAGTSDQGGVTREWFTRLADAFLERNFIESDIEKGLYVSKLCEMPYAQTFGIVMGKALLMGYNIRVPFVGAVFKILKGEKPHISDIRHFNRLLYSLSQEDLALKSETTFIYSLGDIDVDLLSDEEIEFYSEYSEEIQALQEEQISKDLVGEELIVTNETLKIYQYMLTTSILKRFKHYLSPMKRGFGDVISNDLLIHFKPEEIGQLLNGISIINYDDWVKNSSCDFEDPVVIWFWEIVKECDNELRAKILRFVTGSPTAPYNGFANLKGKDDISLFKVEVILGMSTELLPVSSTCFNYLKLPPYGSKEILQTKLFLAIDETSVTER